MMNNIKNLGYILLAEDDVIQQMIVKKYAENLGYEVVVSSNGKEALELMKNKHFDFVLMDIQMPIMSGYEAIKLIRHINQTQLVIALTTLSEKDERDHIMSFGFDRFLSKPVNQSALKNTLDNLTQCNVTVANYKSLVQLNKGFDALDESIFIEQLTSICNRSSYSDVIEMLQKVITTYKKGQYELSKSYLQEAIYMKEDHHQS